MVEIECINCGMSIKEYYEEILMENIPKNIYEGLIWYCSIECYEEKTQHE